MGYGPLPKPASGPTELRYAPNQPRAPAGSPQGGQWTTGGGGGGGGLTGSVGFLDDAAGVADSVDGAADQIALNIDPSVVGDALATPVAEDDTERRYRINLQEEESNYGHTLKKHAEKTDQDLLKRIESERRIRRTPLGTWVDYLPAVGTFDSKESANDFVNRVLEWNKEKIDQLIAGKIENLTLNWIFGFRTGKEAFLQTGLSKPIIRWTFGVRVILTRDPKWKRGYRVRTAFPFNPDARQ